VHAISICVVCTDRQLNGPCDVLLHEPANRSRWVGAEISEGLADQGPAGGARGQVRQLPLRPAPPVAATVAFAHGGGVEGEEGQEDEGEEEEELAGYGGHHGAHERLLIAQRSFLKSMYSLPSAALPA
jgi:hypothetical protein